MRPGTYHEELSPSPDTVEQHRNVVRSAASEYRYGDRPSLRSVPWRLALRPAAGVAAIGLIGWLAVNDRGSDLSVELAPAAPHADDDAGRSTPALSLDHAPVPASFAVDDLWRPGILTAASGDIVLWGGVEHPGGEPSDGEAASRSVDARGAVLHSDSGTWTEVAPSPLVARHGHLMANAADGSVIVAGGRSSRTAAPDLADAAAYDPARDEWTPLPPLPAPRADMSAISLDSRLLVFGGRSRTDDPLGSAPLVLDRARAEWTPVTVGHPVWQAAAVDANTAILVGGDTLGAGSLRLSILDIATLSVTPLQPVDLSDPLWNMALGEPSSGSVPILVTSAEGSGHVIEYSLDDQEIAMTSDVHWDEASAALPSSDSMGRMFRAGSGDWVVVGRTGIDLRSESSDESTRLDVPERCSDMVVGNPADLPLPIFVSTRCADGGQIIELTR